MLLGKRQRPPMKRTTSMTEFTLDLNFSEEVVVAQPQPSVPFSGGSHGPTSCLDQGFLAATVLPRNHRRSSVDFTDSAHFLRSCSLCKRRLILGRDIYMYRGDSAFCSLECRQQQIIQDERKEKCSSASKNEVVAEVLSNNAEAVTAAAV